jgi:hypothetical protein
MFRNINVLLIFLFCIFLVLDFRYVMWYNFKIGVVQVTTCLTLRNATFSGAAAFLADLQLCHSYQKVTR